MRPDVRVTTRPIAAAVLLALCAGASTENDRAKALLQLLNTKPAATGVAGDDPSRGREIRETARSLVEQGTAIQPNIDAVLDLVEFPGAELRFTGNLGFLLDVYALTLGPRSLPRLRRFRDSPQLNPLGLTTILVDEATALALHLTSYVSVKQEPVQYFANYEPRADLDRFLLAWLRNDREWINAKLGAGAKAVMSSLSQGTDWEHLRAKLWPAESAAVGIGFRFTVPGRWSQPSFTLDDDLVAQRKAGVGTQQLGEQFSFPTEFTDSSGAVCGAKEISFVRAPMDDHYGSYRIDNSDLKDLLLLISSCAVK